MATDELLVSLERAKRAVGIVTNRDKKNRVVNQLEKLAHAPLKVLRVAAYRLGLLPGTDLHARMFWGGTLTLPVWDEDAVIAYYTGCFGNAELPLVTYLTRTLTASDVFYDVGANLGLYSALAGARGAEVHTFEPNPRTTSYLSLNATPRTTVNPVALSDTKGSVPFYEVSVGRKVGMSSLFPDVVPQTREHEPSKQDVSALTLDEYVTDHAIPTVVKIDVMNTECLVLAGARTLLSAHAPVIALRLYRNPSAPERTQTTLRLLTEFGYVPFAIGNDGSLTSTTVLWEHLPFATTLIFKKP